MNMKCFQSLSLWFHVLFQLQVRQSVYQAVVILPRSPCPALSPQVIHQPNSPHSKANNSPALRHQRSLWVKRRKKSVRSSWLCSPFREMKLNVRLILTRIIELLSSLIWVTMSPLTSRKAWYEIVFLIKQLLSVPVSSNCFPPKGPKLVARC